MSGALKIASSLVLLALAAAVGYALAGLRRPVEPPSRAIAHATVPTGLTAELRAALVERDLLERAARVAAILEPLGPDALEPVLAAYRSVLIDSGDVELMLLVDWWSRFDPAAAFEWARLSRVGWHPAVLTAALRAWARQDPEAASRALQTTVQDDRLVAAAMVGLVRGWEDSGRDGLQAHLAQLPPGAPRGIEALARGKVARGQPEEVIAWVEDLPDGDSKQIEFKVQASERVVEALADVHPEVAGAWVARQRSDSADGRNLPLVLRLTMRWARNDGEAALRWLSSLPPAGDLPTAVQETYRTWYFADKPAASAWIESVPLEPWLEPAVSTYALQQSTKAPDLALEWANRLSDPLLRERTLVKIGQSYSVAAPEEAQAWLARVELPESVRTQIEAFRTRRAAAAAPSPIAAPIGAAPGASPNVPPVPFALPDGVADAPKAEAAPGP